MFDATGAFHRADTAAEGDELEAVAVGWIERELAAGTFFSWVVEWSGGAGGATARAATANGGEGQSSALPGTAEIVAGGGLQLRPLMPRPGYVQGEPEAIVLSMWTEPAHRRRGLATAVVEAMLAWCRAHGVRRITLHASDEGRPIYARLGFAPTNEMRLELSSAT
jgi:GNAT superfamily N-acetyltransferase